MLQEFIVNVIYTSTLWK